MGVSKTLLLSFFYFFLLFLFLLLSFCISATPFSAEHPGRQGWERYMQGNGRIMRMKTNSMTQCQALLGTSIWYILLKSLFKKMSPRDLLQNCSDIHLVIRKKMSDWHLLHSTLSLFFSLSHILYLQFKG